MRKTSFILSTLFIVCIFSSCQENSGLRTYTGNKILVRLIGEINHSSFIQFDDFKITHLLPDTSVVATEQLNCINVRKLESNHYGIGPSKSKIPTPSNNWITCNNPKGVLVNGWIKAFAYRFNNDRIDEFTLDMSNYLAYEGLFIIERKDGNELTLTHSADLPVLIEILN